MSEYKEEESKSFSKDYNKYFSEKTQLSKEVKLLEFKKPGRLKGEVKLILHTVYSQKLFLGFRPGKRSVNLLQFASRMTELWDAAEQDNPYADWYLLQVYDMLINFQKKIISEIEDYREKLNDSNYLSGLTFIPFLSQEPVIESLWFRTQYGYMAARLIAHFDELMRIILTANRIGILLDKEEKAIRQEWIKEISSLFHLPFNWKPLVITRLDLKNDAQQLKVAIEKMGNVPEDVITLKLRSPFSPLIKQK